MPELPDVELFRRYFDATSLHQRIAFVQVKAPELLRGLSTRQLREHLQGRRFESTHRHGKYLFATTDSGECLMLHFGMTGFLKYFKNPANEPGHDRMLVGFSNGSYLAYDCRRKLGEIGLASDLERFIEERELGPDALDADLDLEEFGKILSRSRGSVKGALMNQKLVAGIGNIYSDEILFQAGVHPREKANELDEKAIKRIYRTMREKVLPTTIECRADPARFPDSYIIPHRHQDEKCPKCGGDLEHIRVSGRITYLCPVHQPKRQ